MKRYMLLLGFFVLVVSAKAGELEWEITNRFRAFDYLGTQDEATKLFDTYAPVGDENDFATWHKNLVIKLESAGKPYSPFATNHGAWDETTGKYDKKYVQLPEVIQIRVRLKDDASPAGANQACQLSIAGSTIPLYDCLKTPTIIQVPSSGGIATLTVNGIDIAAVTIKPRLKVILGLGDSYGAGEGAPDLPTKWKAGIRMKHWPTSESGTEDVGKWVDKPASWLSDRCNRSFFSAQSQTALWLSRDDPHSVVAFVHLSCSGAEVIDGLLAAQRLPAGHRKGCKALSDRRDQMSLDKNCDLKASQLKEAVELLCLGSTNTISNELLQNIKAPLKGIGKASKRSPDQREWITADSLIECEGSKLIAPDLILLSIGGNDIGFAGVIAWALLPSNGRHAIGDLVVAKGRGKIGVVCPDRKSGNCAADEKQASARIRQLTMRYAALDLAMRHLLKVEGKDIVLPTYPNPLFDKAGKLCGDTPKKTVLDNAWAPTRLRIPDGVRPKVWQINLTEWEADQVYIHVISGLNSEIKSSASHFGWTTPDAERIMEKGGWCTDKIGKSKLLPPNQLSTWNVHHENTRRIQTAADSVATQWAIEQRDDWISGTFHPNVWGYADLATVMYRTISNSRQPAK